MNKVILSGFVGGTPAIKEFENGKIATFSLATSKKWKKDGELKEKTTWHNIVIRREALVNIVNMYIGKGSQIGLVGEIDTREYKDNSGNTRYVTEIIADELEFLGGKEKEQKQEKATGDIPF